MKHLFIRIFAAIFTVQVLLLSGCSAGSNLNVDKTGDSKVKEDNKNMGDTIGLKLMIGRDKQWIFDDVQNILDKKNIKVDGKSIHIETDKAGTGEAMEKVLLPDTEYVGWMPASSTHIQWANDIWYKSGNKSPIVEENFITVFLTPTVIAMQESMAKIMGYPAKKIGWNDILKLSTAADGWGIYGKSILNPVRFAHTHPAKSNSGLNALIAAEYAFAGKQKGLSNDDVLKNSEKLKQVEKTIVHYGESTSLLQKKIVEKGPKFIQYAVLYEYMVADMNAKNKDNKEKLIAIYPSEGTIWGDVCFTNVNSKSITDQKKKALEEVKKILMSDEIQKKGMDEYYFRPASASIPLSGAISQNNGVDPKEPQTTLELPKIQVIDAILDDWMKNMKKRANVLFVLDNSGSMAGEPLENSKNAIKNLFNKDVQEKNYTSIDDEDTISLMTFSSSVSDIYTVNGRNITEMNTVLDSINASGNTVLYDSVYKALEEHMLLKQKEQENKIGIIVFLTDGKDTRSKKSLDDLMKYIESQEGNLPVVITIGYGDVDEKILTDISDKTGGKYYKGTPETIKKVFEEIKTFF